MASVVGCADLLLGSPEFSLTPDLRKFVQIIHDAGRNALRMISLSLDMYKMEQGSYVLKPEVVDLIPLISNIGSECSRQVQTKGVLIQMRVRGQPMEIVDQFSVSGEEILCYSLFSNLIKNALEASPRDQPVTVSLDSGGGMSTITIHNMGTVPTEIRERFFGKYVTAGKRSGTGLGTYSARLMAEVQRGSIRMETSEALGTTITVQLPVRSE